MIDRLPSLKEIFVPKTPIVDHAASCDPVGIFDSTADFAEAGGFDEVAMNIACKVWDYCNNDCDMYSPFAICGKWGSGKTSFVHRLIHYMGEDDAAMFFDPWMFEGHKSLAAQFFAQLSQSLEDYPSIDLSRYAQAFVTVASSGVIGLAQTTDLTDGGFSSIALRAFGKLAPYGGGSAQPLLALEKERARVAEQMRVMKRRQVVVIDNLDRLSSVDIRKMFKFLGTVVRLPNVLYILLFDSERVMQALSYGDSSRREIAELYLEKIVPVRIDMPRIDLGSVIEREFGAYPEVKDSMFREVLCSLFETPRTAMKIAANMKMTGLIGSSPVFSESPIADAYIRIAQERLYTVLRAYDNPYTLARDVYGLSQKIHEEAEEQHRKDTLRNRSGVESDYRQNPEALFELINEQENISNVDESFATEMKKKDGEILSAFAGCLNEAEIEVSDDAISTIVAKEGKLTSIERLESIRALGDAGACWLALQAVYLEFICRVSELRSHSIKRYGISFPQ